MIDHGRPLAAQVAALGLGAPGLVFSTTHTDAHLGEIAQLVAPQGRFGFIDDLREVDLAPFKTKSVSIRLESMFTRSVFHTADMAEQHALLGEVARLVDAGTLRTTLSERLSPISAATLRRAHALIEDAWSHGKLVLEGWGG